MDDDRFTRGWIFRAVCSSAGGKKENAQQKNGWEQETVFSASSHSKRILSAGALLRHSMAWYRKVFLCPPAGFYPACSRTTFSTILIYSSMDRSVSKFFESGMSVSSLYFCPIIKSPGIETFPSLSSTGSIWKASL